jgi:hypothetical protein
MTSIEDIGYTIDDYAEAKMHGAIISDPEYDKLMDEIKISDLSLADWCHLIHETKKLTLPNFTHYFAEYIGTDGHPSHREPIYDKIICKLIRKQVYTPVEGDKTFLTQLYDYISEFSSHKEESAPSQK